MKRSLIIALALVCLISIVSCKGDKKNGDDSTESFKIFTTSDLRTQSAVKTKRYLISFDEIDEDGNCKVTAWTCTSINKQNFNFTKDEDGHDDIIVDGGTIIEMGDILNYDGNTPLGLYDKNTSLAFFKKNATQEYNGEPLYFTVVTTGSHADEVSLYWDYYFKTA